MSSFLFVDEAEVALVADELIGWKYIRDVIPFFHIVNVASFDCV